MLEESVLHHTERLWIFSHKLSGNLSVEQAFLWARWISYRIVQWLDH